MVTRRMDFKCLMHWRIDISKRKFEICQSEHLKSEILRLPDTHPRSPAQYDGLACRNEHTEKRAINLLKIIRMPYIGVADISVL